MKNSDGSHTGVEAVIDKDRAGFKLAQAVNADIFLVLTDVEKTQDALEGKTGTHIVKG